MRCLAICEPRRGQEQVLPSVFRRNQPCWHPDFELTASWSVRWCIRVEASRVSGLGYSSQSKPIHWLLSEPIRDNNSVDATEVIKFPESEKNLYPLDEGQVAFWVSPDFCLLLELHPEQLRVIIIDNRMYCLFKWSILSPSCLFPWAEFTSPLDWLWFFPSVLGWPVECSREKL